MLFIRASSLICISSKLHLIIDIGSPVQSLHIIHWFQHKRNLQSQTRSHIKYRPVTCDKAPTWHNHQAAGRYSA